MKKIEITAKCEVRFSRTVEMSDADFAEYEAIVSSQRSPYKIDGLLEGIAEGYGIRKPDSACDFGELEDITFEKADDKTA